MRYRIEIRLPSGEWAPMQWCGGTFATEAVAKRACASFEAYKLPVRIAELQP
jgi:hypothetical protein